MPERLAFCDLVAGLLNGQDAAVYELVAAYVPQIKPLIHRDIARHHLCRFLDAEDVLQDVLLAFTRDMRQGKYLLDTADGLRGLLLTIAKHRVADLGRHFRRENDARDQTAEAQASLPEQSDDGLPIGGTAADWDELLIRVLPRLSMAESAIVWRRACGLDWNQIAIDLQRTKGSLRKQFKRACLRVRKQLDPPRERSAQHALSTWNAPVAHTRYR